MSNPSAATAGAVMAASDCALRFTAADIGFMRIGFRGAIIDANDYLLGQLLHSKQTLTSLHFWDLGGAVPPEVGLRLLERLIRTGHLRSADFPVQRSDGHLLKFQFRHLGTVDGDSDLIECRLEPADSDESRAVDRAADAKSIDQRTLCSHHFEVTAQREIDRARENGAPLAMLSIAIDRIGAASTRRPASTSHLLSGFASTCAGVLRTTDIVCRAEDTVYVALLPGTNTRAALCVAERLRTAIASMGGLAQNSQMRRVTVSIGVVATRTGRTTYRAMRSRADSKRDDAAYIGGNRVSA